MRKPNLLILDQELLRDIMVRNFKNFQNNGFSSVIDKETDPILGRNPFVLENEEWKTKRAEITPAFTASRVSKFLININYSIESTKLLLLDKSFIPID